MLVGRVKVPESVSVVVFRVTVPPVDPAESGRTTVGCDGRGLSWASG